MPNCLLTLYLFVCAYPGMERVASNNLLSHLHDAACVQLSPAMQSAMEPTPTGQDILHEFMSPEPVVAAADQHISLHWVPTPPSAGPAQAMDPASEAAGLLTSAHPVTGLQAALFGTPLADASASPGLSWGSGQCGSTASFTRHGTGNKQQSQQRSEATLNAGFCHTVSPVVRATTPGSVSPVQLASTLQPLTPHSTVHQDQDVQHMQLGSHVTTGSPESLGALISNLEEAALALQKQTNEEAARPCTPQDTLADEFEHQVAACHVSPYREFATAARHSSAGSELMDNMDMEPLDRDNSIVKHFSGGRPSCPTPGSEYSLDLGSFSPQSSLTLPRVPHDDDGPTRSASQGDLSPSFLAGRSGPRQSNNTTPGRSRLGLASRHYNDDSDDESSALSALQGADSPAHEAAGAVNGTPGAPATDGGRLDRESSSVLLTPTSQWQALFGPEDDDMQVINTATGSVAAEGVEQVAPPDDEDIYQFEQLQQHQADCQDDHEGGSQLSGDNVFLVPHQEATALTRHWMLPSDGLAAPEAADVNIKEEVLDQLQAEVTNKTVLSDEQVHSAAHSCSTGTHEAAASNAHHDQVGCLTVLPPAAPVSLADLMLLHAKGGNTGIGEADVGQTIGMSCPNISARMVTDMAPDADIKLPAAAGHAKTHAADSHVVAAEVAAGMSPSGTADTTDTFATVYATPNVAFSAATPMSCYHTGLVTTCKTQLRYSITPEARTVGSGCRMTASDANIMSALSEQACPKTPGSTSNESASSMPQHADESLQAPLSASPGTLNSLQSDMNSNSCSDNNGFNQHCAELQVATSVLHTPADQSGAVGDPALADADNSADSMAHEQTECLQVATVQDPNSAVLSMCDQDAVVGLYDEGLPKEAVASKPAAEAKATTPCVVSTDLADAGCVTMPFPAAASTPTSSQLDGAESAAAADADQHSVRAHPISVSPSCGLTDVTIAMQAAADDVSEVSIGANIAPAVDLVCSPTAATPTSRLLPVDQQQANALVPCIDVESPFSLAVSHHEVMLTEDALCSTPSPTAANTVSRLQPDGNLEDLQTEASPVSALVDALDLSSQAASPPAPAPASSSLLDALGLVTPASQVTPASSREALTPATADGSPDTPTPSLLAHWGISTPTDDINDDISTGSRDSISFDIGPDNQAHGCGDSLGKAGGETSSTLSLQPMTQAPQVKTASGLFGYTLEQHNAEHTEVEHDHALQHAPQLAAGKDSSSAQSPVVSLAAHPITLTPGGSMVSNMTPGAADTPHSVHITALASRGDHSLYQTDNATACTSCASPYVASLSARAAVVQPSPTLSQLGFIETTHLCDDMPLGCSTPFEDRLAEVDEQHVTVSPMQDMSDSMTVYHTHSATALHASSDAEPVWAGVDQVLLPAHQEAEGGDSMRYASTDRQVSELQHSNLLSVPEAAQFLNSESQPQHLSGSVVGMAWRTAGIMPETAGHDAEGDDVSMMTPVVCAQGVSNATGNAQEQQSASSWLQSPQLAVAGSSRGVTHATQTTPSSAFRELTNRLSTNEVSSLQLSARDCYTAVVVRGTCQHVG